ncbi:methyltransferase domain-containing protein [Streptosporangium sp. NPDC051022]|uniref:class I SAM-dependent methyltransferase n=1 Tax=Streptosporangium sp. NPDC051022 TaxID=3155752 RepID=UPI00343FCFCA
MLTKSKQELDRMRSYYTSDRKVGGIEESIYAIWERGDAFNDSITPSTYVPEYRHHMVLKLLSLTRDGAEIFSLGCGNGFVEGELASLRRRVRAIDFNEEAVELTRGKGVDAFTADFYGLVPSDIANADVIYADGFLGHVFDPGEKAGLALAKLKSLNPKPGAYLVFSNDAPKDTDVPFAMHERVEDFWFISKDHLKESLESFGLPPAEHYYFPYLRPMSGMRNRTICVARIP